MLPFLFQERYFSSLLSAMATSERVFGKDWGPESIEVIDPKIAPDA